jgi:hypothetical protein
MIKFRLPFLIFAFVNLICGMLAGLVRLGWNFPLGSVATHHGAIMVGGFLGTLILLEKVIPLKKKILFVFPVINALSLIMIVPTFNKTGQTFLIIGAVGMLLVLTLYFIKYPSDLSNLLMMAGAFSLLIGHIMLISKQFYPMAFPWWMGFILLTIVGERIELSKFLPVTQSHKNILLSFLCIFIVGLCLPFHTYGKYLSGAALILVSIWLMRHDVISVAIKKDGLTKFSASALLAGCVFLMLTGILLICIPDIPYGYDAIVHTFFLGFAFTMIFAHGPIILPGVLGFGVKPYHPSMYLPLTTLVASLIVRLLADTALLSYSLRIWSGWISAGSILLYFILLFSFTIRKVYYAKAV